MAEPKSERAIDATGLILGRMASTVAKGLLFGEKITIVNAEKAVISGRKKNIIDEARKFLEIGHPGKGPYHPRTPDQIVRRTVRGMLPRKKPKGQQAYKRLRVYIGVPEDLKEKKLETIPEIDSSKLRCPYIKVSDLAREIGWNQVVE